MILWCPGASHPVSDSAQDQITTVSCSIWSAQQNYFILFCVSLQNTLLTPISWYMRNKTTKMQHLYLWFTKLDFWSRQEPRDVVLHVLKHKVYATRQSRSNQALQFNDVWMIKPPKNHYFSCHKPHTLWLKIVKSHLLQSYYLPSLNLLCSENTTIRSLANLFIQFPNI